MSGMFGAVVGGDGCVLIGIEIAVEVEEVGEDVVNYAPVFLVDTVTLL